jgi:phosphatidyl-myo-inositol dimannoside synthase
VLYGCADVFAMACRSRWGGLEQEGFGIVFVEAAACGVVQVAGDSGGAAEAVDDGVTGLVVRRPEDAREVAAAFEALLDDPVRRADMGQAARKRAVAEFSYDVLAERLGRSLGVW